MPIMLVDADGQTARQVLQGLRASGHSAEFCSDGRDALARALSERFELLIIDCSAPHLGGLSIVAELRARADRTPVLLLGALDTVADRVEALRAGGDDCLAKPFAWIELLARVEALLRRQWSPALAALRVADLRLDVVARRAARAGRGLTLTAKEFQLLEFLMRRAGQVVSRAMMLEAVWNLRFDPRTNLIDVHMSRLRAAVDRGFPRPLLHTVRGMGYVVEDRSSRGGPRKASPPREIEGQSARK